MLKLASENPRNWLAKKIHPRAYDMLSKRGHKYGLGMMRTRTSDEYQIDP